MSETEQGYNPEPQQSTPVESWDADNKRFTVERSYPLGDELDKIKVALAGDIVIQGTDGQPSLIIRESVEGDQEDTARMHYQFEMDTLHVQPKGKEITVADKLDPAAERRALMQGRPLIRRNVVISVPSEKAIRCNLETRSDGDDVTIQDVTLKNPHIESTGTVTCKNVAIQGLGQIQAEGEVDVGFRNDSLSMTLRGGHVKFPEAFLPEELMDGAVLGTFGSEPSPENRLSLTSPKKVTFEKV